MNILKNSTVDTGLDKISFQDVSIGGIELLSPPGDLISDLKSFLDTVLKDCKSASADKTLPKHVRFLALWSTSFAEDIQGAFYRGQKVRPEVIEHTEMCIELGMYYERFRLVEAERAAAAGKKSRTAAQKRNRRAPAGSLREFFQTMGKNWRDRTAQELRSAAIKKFPGRDPDDIQRQIARLKKTASRP